MKRTLRLFLTLSMAVLCTTMIQAQEKTYSGTVKSAEDGQVIIGANVTVEGTTKGASTGVDGKFSIKAAAGEKLVFSYLGMTSQTVVASTATTINITLAPTAEDIGGVVVVAFGTARKQDLTGAVSSIDSKTLAQQQVTSVSQAVEGAVSGVQVSSLSGGQPGVDTRIVIRGMGSISSASTALVVVDGVPTSAPLSSINPNDIASISVSKDAASNSLYGSRAANGVVLVTTKKGQSGNTQISFQSRMGINQQGVPQYDVIDDPAQYYEYSWRLLYNKARYYVGTPKRKSDGTLYYDLPGVQTVKDGPYANLSDADARQYASNSLFKYPNNGSKTGLGNYMLFKLQDPTQTLIDPATGKIREGSTLMYQDNWNDELTTTAFRQEYNVNISGSTDKTDYFISTGYLSNPAYVVGSVFNRYTGRINVNTQVTNWLKSGANLAYARRFTNNPGYATAGTVNTNPFAFMQMFGALAPYYAYDKDGQRVKDSNGKSVYDLGQGQTYSPYGPTQRAAFNGYTPAIYLFQDKRVNTTDEISARPYLEATFLKDFKFTTNLGMDNSYDFGVRYGNPTSGGEARDYKGTISNQYDRSMTINTVQLLSWSKQVGLHRLDVMAGHEFNTNMFNTFYASKKNMYAPNQPELSNAVTPVSSSGSSRKTALEGYFGKITDTYNEKYSIDASIRRDGASLYQNNMWGTFGAVGLAWQIGRENFIVDNASWVNSLKLRTSYGITGNATPPSNNYYPYTDIWNVVLSTTDQVALNNGTFGNPNLTWEKNATFDAGMDFRLWDRFTGSVTWFTRTTNGLIWTRPLAASTGVTGRAENTTSLRNRGIEVELGVDIIRQNDLYWNMSVNVTHTKNTLLSVPDGIGSVALNGNFQSGNFLRGPGKDYYNLSLYKFAGVDQETGYGLYYKKLTEKDVAGTQWSSYKAGDIVTTPIVSEATYFEMGSAAPDFIGGWSTNLRYKAFDLAIFTSFQVGGKGIDLTQGSGTLLGRGVITDNLKGWLPDNPNNRYPLKADGVGMNAGSGDYYLLDASYFSLRNVTLGYNLPSSIAKRLSVSNLRVYLAGENLWLLSNRKGFDPRLISYDPAANATIAAYSFPMTRSISLGINLTF